MGGVCAEEGMVGWGAVVAGWGDSSRHVSRVCESLTKTFHTPKHLLSYLVSPSHTFTLSHTSIKTHKQDPDSWDGQKLLRRGAAHTGNRVLLGFINIVLGFWYAIASLLLLNPPHSTCLRFVQRYFRFLVGHRVSPVPHLPSLSRYFSYHYHLPN